MNQLRRAHFESNQPQLVVHDWRVGPRLRDAPRLPHLARPTVRADS
jgi:hypothetical protein